MYNITIHYRMAYLTHVQVLLQVADVDGATSDRSRQYKADDKPYTPRETVIFPQVSRLVIYMYTHDVNIRTQEHVMMKHYEAFLKYNIM